MRLPGRMAPAAVAGPLGQFAIARVPARTVEKNEVLSCRLRPAISFAFASPVSAAVLAASARRCAESLATSPPLAAEAGDAVESGAAAFALGLVPQAPSATSALNP